MPVILHLYSITVDLKSNSDSSAGFHDAFIITTFHAPVFFTVFISDQTLSFLRAPYFNLDTCCRLEGQSNQSPEGGEPLRRAHSAADQKRLQTVQLDLHHSMRDSLQGWLVILQRYITFNSNTHKGETRNNCSS